MSKIIKFFGNKFNSLFFAYLNENNTATDGRV